MPYWQAIFFYSTFIYRPTYIFPSHCVTLLTCQWEEREQGARGITYSLHRKEERRVCSEFNSGAAALQLRITTKAIYDRLVSE